MKKINYCIFYLLGLMVISINSFGQTADHKWGWSILGGVNQYKGDLGNEFFKVGQGSMAFQTGPRFYLNSSLNIAANVSIGELDIKSETASIQSDLLDGDIGLEYKLYNGYLLSEEAKLKPFIHAGIGRVRFDNESDTYIPIGFGLRYRVFPDLDIQIGSAYKHVFSNDTYNYLQHNFGIVINIGEENEQTAAPAPAVVKEMPKVIDSDNDGIADEMDECPNAAGPAATKGCPDKDGDGILDKDDACPSIAGLANFQGCPDTDGDGIQDNEDTCPALAGPAATKGCPDKDNDTVADKDDKCPEIAGLVANKGCPEVEEADKKVFQQALRGIQFETGKTVIKRSSYSILDNIVAIMKKHTEYNLSISGHTDNTGNADSNMKLSDARAKAAMQYLIDKGVEASRLTAKGYGITQPIADNNTAAGRAENRRVEFKVIF